jgi:hypothetical protein
MDLLHTTGLFDEQGIAVDARIAALSSLLVHLANLKDVLKTIQSNLDDLVVRASEEVAKRLNASLRNEVADLIGLLETTRGGVGYGPASFLAGLEVAIGEQVDQWGNDTGIDNRLDLAGVTSSDVGDGPAGLLADSILRGAQKGQKGGKGTTVDDDLSLDIVTGNDITHRPQSGGLDGSRSVHKKFDQTARDAGLDNSLDLVVGTVGEVGDGPASVNQDLIVKHVDELSEDRESRGNLHEGVR